MGRMARREDDSPACPGCGGRGRKLRRSRRVLVRGTLMRGTAEPARVPAPIVMAPAMRGELAATMPAQLWFPGTASAVSQARRFVAGAIGDGFPALDDVLVLVSEVASNAVKHTASGDGGAFEVAVRMTGGSVRVEIGDQGSASEPRLADDGPADAPTGGRGLRIVDSLAAKWGHAGDELGRVVWFEVQCP